MKHLFIIFFICAFNVCTFAETIFTVDHITYRVTSYNEVEIDYKNSDDNKEYWDNKVLIVPEQVRYNGRTYTVTSIECSAFALFGITEAYIPNTVKELGPFVFDRCRKLQKAVIGSGVSTIPRETFNECNELKSVDLYGDSLRLEASSFVHLPVLTKINILGTLYELCEHCIYDCPGIAPEGHGPILPVSSKHICEHVEIGKNTGIRIYVDN